MTTTFTTTCSCPNCGGTGKLPHFSHIANGDCFACGATGVLDLKESIGPNSDVVLDVMLRNGEFWYATLRCRTWKYVKSGDGKTYHQWERDRWYKEIHNAEEARAIWRTAKQNNIKTSCGH